MSADPEVKGFRSNHLVTFVCKSVYGGWAWLRMAQQGLKAGHALAFRKWYSQLPVSNRAHKPSPHLHRVLLPLSDTVGWRQNLSLLLLSCLGALQPKPSLSHTVSVCGPFGKQLLRSLITCSTSEQSGSSAPLSLSHYRMARNGIPQKERAGESSAQWRWHCKGKWKVLETYMNLPLMLELTGTPNIRCTLVVVVVLVGGGEGC